MPTTTASPQPKDETPFDMCDCGHPRIEHFAEKHECLRLDLDCPCLEFSEEGTEANDE